MLLEISDLKMHFPLGRKKTVHAVDGVSLSIAEQEIVGLVGESGSGKTTLGKTVAGLLSRTAGDIHYQGELLPAAYSQSDFRKYSSDIQMIFQDPYASLNPRMTAEEIIAEPLRLNKEANKNIKNGEIRERVAYWLERVGLHADQMGRYPHEFSGGQRQRLGIARALINEPKLVICDEPISALDVSVQAQVVNLLEDLQQTMSLTLLFIAHDLSMVRYISHRMAVMYLGALVEEGPSEEVYSRPRHPYTQLLVQSNPEPDPKLEKTREHSLIQGEIPSPINKLPGCRFAGRCPYAEARCHNEEPLMREVADKHKVACHFAEKLFTE